MSSMKRLWSKVRLNSCGFRYQCAPWRAAIAFDNAVRTEISIRSIASITSRSFRSKT